MLRCALVLVVITACAGSSVHGPAWPKQHEAEADGGESLAPHESRQVAASGLGKDDDAEAKPAPGDTAAAPAAAATETAAPAVTTPGQAPADETINTEEIVIEIDE
ncbi:MAG: hypothetical protein ABI467_04565 [Kofleriaceae bacterium]